MIKKFLIQLRQQPKHIRDNVALIIAGSFTALVGVVWAYQIPNSFKNIEIDQEASPTGAFSSIFDEIQKETDELKALIPEEVGEEAVPTTTDKLFAVESLPNPATTTSSDIDVTPTESPIPREVRIVTTSSSGTPTTSSEKAE